MSLNFGPNPVIYTTRGSDGQIKSYPGVSDVAHGSVVDVGYTRDGRHRTLNDDIIDARVPEAARNVLDRAGWDGKSLTTAQKVQLEQYADQNGHSFSFNIHHAYEAEPWWQGGASATAQPTPVPVQGSELYESGHEISEKLPKGTKIRRAVGAFETAWGGARAFWVQAARDGVPTSETELRHNLSDLLVFFDALQSAYAEGLDYLKAEDREDCQLACDGFWNTIHEARRKALAAKQDGYELVVGDPRPALFVYSRLNRIAWEALRNITAACGLYGLRGELMPDGSRQAEYYDAFMSPESQHDPIRDQTTGGGFHVAGDDSLAAAVASRS